MNPTYQLLLDSFNQVAADPDALPRIHLDRFPTDSDERRLFQAFQHMLERVAESKQAALHRYETHADSMGGRDRQPNGRTVAWPGVPESPQDEPGYRKVEGDSRALIGATHDVVLVFDGSGQLLVASGNFRLLSSQSMELVGKGLHDVFPVAEAEYFLGRIREALRSGQHIEHEYAQEIEGEQRWFVAALSPEEGERVVMVVREISARKWAEIQLQEKERQYRSIFEATSDGLVIRDLAGTIVEANPAYCRMHGYTREELIGQSLTALIHPHFLYLFNERNESFNTGSQEQRVETVNLRKDGTPLPIEVRGTSFTYRGQPHILAIVRDITQRKKAEAQLREKEEQYRSVFESTMDGLMIAELETGNLITVNPAFAQMHGFTVEELTQLHPTAFIHPDYHALFFNYVERVAAGKTFRAEAVDVRKDGSHFPIEVHASGFAYGGKRHVLGVVRDITERVQAYDLLEQRVQERTRELSTLRDISQNIASTLELKALLELILDHVRAVASYSRASIAIREGDHMVIIAYQGRFRPQEVVGERLPLASLGMIWERFNTGHHVLIDDIHGDSPAARAVQQYVGQQNIGRLRDIRSSVLVPLINRERVIGYLNVAHQDPNYYTEYQATLLMAIAHQVAGAIENARLYQHAQEETQRAAALAKVASNVALGGTLATALGQVAQSVVEASGAVACSIIIATADQSRIEVFGNIGMPDGYAAALEAIIQSGQKIYTVEHYDDPGPLVVHGFRQRVLTQSSLAPLRPFMEQVTWDRMVSLPIVYQERHLGRLNLYYPTDTEPRAEELSFLSAVVSQAATAIENARLYVQAQTAAATEERQRLARELHDSVSQALYGIGLGTYAARNLLERNQPGALDALDYVTSLAAAGLAEMRALIFELRPESLEVEGLVAALSKQAEALRARYRLTVQADLPGEPELPLHIKEALYRVAQEALHNTVKHAEAQMVHLKLDYGEDAITLDMRDDGKGFDPGGSFPGHLGLQSMRERVARLGGTFDISSAPGAGTTVRVRLPYRNSEVRQVLAD